VLFGTGACLSAVRRGAGHDVIGALLGVIVTGAVLIEDTSATASATGSKSLPRRCSGLTLTRTSRIRPARSRPYQLALDRLQTASPPLLGIGTNRLSPAPVRGGKVVSESRLSEVIYGEEDRMAPAGQVAIPSSGLKLFGKMSSAFGLSMRL
jgi:hypothetical protein